MKKERSFLELQSLPLKNLSSGISLASVLNETKYDHISEDDKRDLIILKEAFVIVDRKRKEIGEHVKLGSRLD